MDNSESRAGIICESCQNRVNLNDKNSNNIDKTIDKCKNWLSSCNLSDCSIYEEISASSDAGTSIDDNLSDNNRVENKICLNDAIIAKDENILFLNEVINNKPSYFENIQVYKSKHVHIGDVTHINGPIYINQLNPTLTQNITINNQNDNQKSEVHIVIVPRRTWLAQPPLDPDDVKTFLEPVKFVIFSHSATEEGYTQTDNNLIVRLIQQFHIESQKRNDISYNFLIGADGSIYEGRGWKTVGAHAFGYNRIALGICFIGCYMNKLPPENSLKKAKDLIQYGVDIGAIDQDYKILAHRQCSSTESPGARLFKEIKTWDRWESTVSVEHPSPYSPLSKLSS